MKVRCFLKKLPRNIMQREVQMAKNTPLQNSIEVVNLLLVLLGCENVDENNLSNLVSAKKNIKNDVAVWALIGACERAIDLLKMIKEFGNQYIPTKLSAFMPDDIKNKVKGENNYGRQQTK